VADNSAFWIILAIAMASLVISSIQRAAIEKEQGLVKATQIIMDGGPMSFAQDGRVDEGKLQAVLGEDYGKIKETLGLKGNFCIYFEDADGRVIPVSGDTLGFGSGEISINERSCKWG